VNEDNWSFGSGGYAKLYGDRLAQSSLMDRNVVTRWLFVFVLSQADAQGRYRCASVAGLARAAAITLEQAELAVSELEAPDPDSTTKAEDGRRIVRIPGGWRVVTYTKYREYRTARQLAEAAKKRRQREAAKSRRDKRKAPVPGTCPPRPRDVPGTAPQTSAVNVSAVNDQRSSNETERDPVAFDSLADELLNVCRRIADAKGCSVTAIVRRVSAIPAGNGHGAKEGFDDPRAKGITEGWIRGALGRAREFLTEMERPVPL
jgi:hypothetical protein